MTKTTPSPLLKKFIGFTALEMHTIAAKVNIMAGLEACKSNKLAGALWNEDKTSLVITFTNGFQTTFILDRFRLLTKCNCNLWQPARNCPHVVLVWATLKRVVSPESLRDIKFNKQLLLDMKQFADQEPPTGKEALHNDKIQEKGLLDATRLRDEELARIKSLSEFRLVVETDRSDSGIKGGFERGNRVVHGWTDIGIPTDLARFLSTYPYYESTPRYFETFLKQTQRRYPIVFRNAEAKETVLLYSPDEPRNAGITFDIRGEEVHISRSLGSGDPIPIEAVIHGRLLFNPESGTIHAIASDSAWKTWDKLIHELYAAKDKFYELDAVDNDDEIGSIVNSRLLSRVRHALVVPLKLFNSARIRFTSLLLDNFDEQCRFNLNGNAVGDLYIVSPSYMLNIPSGRERPSNCSESKTNLELSGLYNGQTFPCSSTFIKLLNPAGRSGILSSPLRSKKRLRAILEAAFSVLDETETTAGRSYVRALSDSPDFSAQELLGEAREILNILAYELSQKELLLLAADDGWHCVDDDLRQQARLLRVLFDLIGLENFCTSSRGFAAWSGRLDEVLPQLISRLQSDGFSLQMVHEPVVAASWEFALDATNSGIDWFELKPEIRCNGVILTEAEMSGLFSGAGMLRRDGKVLMLDGLSAEIMTMLSGAMPGGRKKRKGGAEPVRVPRLQILDWLNLRSHGVVVTLSPGDAAILESLLNFSRIPERILPTGLNATLRQYQVDAWRWLAFLYDHRFGACLADDMGLGKTLQAITLLAGIMTGEIASAAPHGTQHLVVAPPTLMFNWEAEIARFFPSAKVCLYAGSGRSIDSFDDQEIIITSYGMIQRDIDQLEKLRFNVIIFDETQVVKNLKAVTSSAVRRLKGAFVLGLTGTPVENHLGEYYAIMDLCLPGLLGTREEFSRKDWLGNPDKRARLIGRTRPFVLRRTKQLIATELPPKIEMDINLELTPKQQALYQRTVEEVRGQIHEAYKSHTAAQARIIALTAILRLRQICLAPALASKGAGAAETSPKLEFLAEQLQELRDEGHSALVFSQFTGYLDIIEKGLKAQGLNCLRLDGSTPVPQRRKLVQSFQNSDEPTVFLISLKAGGKGLNLTRATYIYHMDPWWNPAVENQASDRAHRIGQTEQVTITRLIMRHTIEEKMMALKEQKTQLYKAILEDGTGGGGTGLTPDDFEFLLG